RAPSAGACRTLLGRGVDMANMENKGRFDTGALGRPDIGQSAAGVAEKAKETGSQAIEKAKDMGSQVLEKAKDYASSAAEKASETYEAGRHYVTERGIRGMTDDVAEVIRRNPLPAVLVGLGIGFLLARALRED